MRIIEGCEAKAHAASLRIGLMLKWSLVAVAIWAAVEVIL